MDLPTKKHEKIKLVEINPYLTCFLCKGYFIDATTISECLHSFCRSCIIKFLQDNSHCPKCEVLINKAKPNIKLDKTLQDIVYKLVPELFIKEMTRRQRFYQNHPEIAAKATPEERGEDTERTIFNPSDVISLSIEYIRDDSTPGAIVVPGCKNGIVKSDASEVGTKPEEDPAMMRRFLQCPALCRVDVLKKFVRNKYSVDTSLFYIDILYKRVPLPDHYTLIDIAYIFSWKRNEPMKFFFRIIDINLVKERIDYLPSHPIPEVLSKLSTPNNIDNNKEKPNKKVQQNTSHIGKENVKNNNNNNVESDSGKKEDLEKELTEQIKNRLQNETTNDKKPVYTNITLNRSLDMEIITKIQKVSNKNGQPIGLNIIKQTVKKTKSTNVQNEQKTIEQPKPQESSEKTNELNKIESKPTTSQNQKPSSSHPKISVSNKPIATITSSIPIPNPFEIDEEKSRFLKSIELTAKNVIQAMSTQKMEMPKLEVPKSSQTKRKNPSPVKNEKSGKKSRVLKNEKKSQTKQLQATDIQNPTVRQMVTNVNQNVSNMNKIVEQTNQKQSTNKELQSLFDSCKINIPSSLSITLKDNSDEDTSRKLLGPIKPVQNYIEILKLPESKENDGEKPPSLTSNLRSIRTKKTETTKQETQQEDTKTEENKLKTPTNKPNIPCKVSNMPKDNLIKLNPRSAQTFQKMFEEAIKKPEFKNKFQSATPVPKPELKQSQKSALDLSTNETNSSGGGKRNILEIASQLYKKTKMEQEKNGLSENKEIPTGKVAIPRLNHQKTLKPQVNKSAVPNNLVQNGPIRFPQMLTNLHSQSLGMNYSVSISQNVSSKSSVPKISSPTPSSSPKPALTSPKLNPASPVPNVTSPLSSPRLNITSPKPNVLSPKQKESSTSPKSSPTCKPSSSSKTVDIKSEPLSPPTTTTTTPTTTPTNKTTQSLNPNQILEKYNIQNLAQLTASFNFGMTPAGQLAALQQAMFLKHFEMQNRQNWLNMNPSPLVQYEKYLQSLSQNQNHLLGNGIKEN